MRTKSREPFEWLRLLGFRSRSGAPKISAIRTDYLDEPESRDEQQQCLELVRSVRDWDSIERRVQCYELCIEQFPKIDIGYMKLARAQSTQEAVSLLETALECCRCRSSILHCLGTIHLENGDRDEAIAALTSAICAARGHLSDVGESYLYLALIFSAAQQGDARAVEKKGKELSGCHFEDKYVTEMVFKIRGSGRFTKNTISLIRHSYQILQRVLQPEEIDDESVTGWASVLQSLPVVPEDTILQGLIGSLLRKADLQHVGEWVEAHPRPLREVESVPLIDVMNLLTEQRTICEEFKSLDGIDWVDPCKDLTIVEREGLMVGMALTRFGINPAYPFARNCLWRRWVVRTGEDAYVVYDA